MSLITFADLSQSRTEVMLRDIVDEDIKSKPELSIFNARTIPMTKYKRLRKVATGDAKFRRLNQGAQANTAKPRWEPQEVTTAYIERETDYDVKLEDELADQENAIFDIRQAHLADAVEGINRRICANIWYGTDADMGGDAEGFEGFWGLTHTDFVYSAGAGDAGNHRSVFLIRQGGTNPNTGASLIFGGNRTLGLRHNGWQIKKKSAKDTGEYTARFQETVAQPGLDPGAKFNVLHIKNLTRVGQGNPLTDDVVHTAIAEKFAAYGIDPRGNGAGFSRSERSTIDSGSWLAWMPPAAQEDLRQSRTNVNGLPRRADGAHQEDLPHTIAGIPIVTTPFLLATEA